MKKILLSLQAIALLCACNVGLTTADDDEFDYKNATSTPITIDTRAAGMICQTNEMSWNLLRQSLSDEKNTLLSPFSLSACLAMLDNGACGETEEQIRQFLGFQDYSQDEFNDFFRHLLHNLPKVDTSVKFTSANSFWFATGFVPKAAFKKNIADYYDGEAFNVNFNLPGTVNDVNNWCSQKTNGLIPQFLTSLPDHTKALLINAIYFKGAWATEFDKKLTRQLDFHLRNGETVSADFMSRQSEELAYDDEEVTIVKLALGKFSRFSTFFVLPKEGVSMTQAANVAQQAFLNERSTESAPSFSLYTANLDIPKFKFENNRLLNNTLKAMGLENIFGSAGDFSNMFEDKQVELTFVRQACSFAVSEKEVEAAAVTGAGLDNFLDPAPSAPLDFKLDRPFLYGLYEQTSGTILFLGAMENPALSEDTDD